MQSDAAEKGTSWFLFLGLTNFSLFPGVISYTEYLFLLCILTSEYLKWLKTHCPEKDSEFESWLTSVIDLISEPHAGFRIAFNMFDADGNEMVDKREFLVVRTTAL